MSNQRKRFLEEQKSLYWIIMLGKISAVFFCIVFLFFIINFIFTTYLNIHALVRKQFPTDLYNAPYPYLMFKGLPYLGDHNEGGYRGLYPSKHKPTQEYRILVLGGLNVYGGEPSVVELLNEEFQKHGYTNVRVFNLGVMSTNSSQELATIVMEVRSLNPDLIIQYDGVADIYYPLYYDPRPGYPYDFLVYEASPLLYPKNLSALKFFLYKNSIVQFLGELLYPHFFIHQFLPLDQLRQEVKYGTEEWRKKIADAYVINIRKAYKISKAFGSEYMVVFEPTVYEKKMLTDEEKTMVLSSEVIHFTTIKNYILSAMNTDQNVHIPFVDMMSHLSSLHDTVFVDVMRIKQNKQLFIAQIIYQSITEEFYIPFP